MPESKPNPVISVAPMPPRPPPPIARLGAHPRLAEIFGELLLPVRSCIHRRSGAHRALLRGPFRAGGHRDRGGVAVGWPGEILPLSGFFPCRVYNPAGAEWRSCRLLSG